VVNDNEFKEMVAEVSASPALYRPSRFWDPLNSLNQEWLEEFGLEQFKRTVSQNYFNWMVVSPFNVQFRAVFKEWLRSPSLRPFRSRMGERGLIRAIGPKRSFGPYQRFIYRLFVSMGWEVAANDDTLSLRSRLDEPSLGTPIEIWSDGKRISQDLVNSIRECNAVDRFCTPLTVGSPVVAELGAGYGRLASVFLAGTKARYVIFDIPPALYVSQWYLTRLFPERKIFKFRHFDRFGEIEKELEQSDLAFFTPNQLRSFPDAHFDAFVSISTLPEMSLDQIANYLVEMARLARSGVYLKQWREALNAQDGYRFNYQSLVLPEPWKLQLDRRDAVQPLFQERAWSRTQAT
jgi:putative sugar O-methyltransferase